MSAHRAEGPRRASPGGWLAVLRQRRVRALLAAGCLVGLGSVSTLAFWTDTATVPTGSFASGGLDLLIDGDLVGPGGTRVRGDLALDKMVPGESVSVTLVVRSAAGTLPLDYYATATSTGDLAPALRWTVVPGATAAAQTGDQTTGDRAGTCTTGTPTVTDQVLGATAVAVIGTNTAAGRRDLAAGASENVCLRVRLDPATGNGLQNKSATATFTLNASQMGAP